jgi:hypothetical protein
MSARSVESLLARLYTDAVLRREFLADPQGLARREGLGDAEVAGMVAVDRECLELAAASYARKRASRIHRRWWDRLRALYS